MFYVMNDFKRKFWLGIGTICLVLVVWGGAFYWLAGNLQVQAKGIATSRSLAQKNSQLVDVLAGLKRNSSDVDLYQKQIDSLLPNKEHLIDIPNTLEGIARANQVSVDFQFQGEATPSQPSQLGSIGFRLYIQGPYGGLIGFLQAFENKSTRFVANLNDFDLTLTNGQYQLVANGRVYFK